MVYIDPSEDMESYAWTPNIYEKESPGALNVRSRGKSNGIDTSPLTIPPPSISSPIPLVAPFMAKPLSNGFANDTTPFGTQTGFDLGGIISWVVSNPLILLLALPLLKGRGGIGKLLKNPMILLFILPMLGLDLFNQKQGGGGVEQVAFGGMNSPITAQSMMLWGLLPRMGTMATMLLGGLGGVLGQSMFKPQRRTRRSSYRRSYPRRRYYKRRYRRY